MRLYFFGCSYKKNLKNLEEHLDQDETVQFSCFGLLLL